MAHFLLQSESPRRVGVGDGWSPQGRYHEDIDSGRWGRGIEDRIRLQGPIASGGRGMVQGRQPAVSLLEHPDAVLRSQEGFPLRVLFCGFPTLALGCGYLMHFCLVLGTLCGALLRPEP